MSILDAYGDDVMAAASRYMPQPKVEAERKFSTWRLLSAAPRAVAEAGAQVLGSASDLLNAFGSAGAIAAEADPFARAVVGSKAIEEGGRLGRAELSSDAAMSSALGDALRERGREFRPDPETAHTAESVLYGFARGATKVVTGAVTAGPAGVLAAGFEEGMTVSDELRREGVDLSTRMKAGGVQGAGLALAVLPAYGATLKATAALYAAGGPGAFIAQQALTREILSGAGYDKIGAQYDPFDPVGLAVASLIPAGFAAWGVRGVKKAAAAKAAEDFRTGPVPSEPAPMSAAVRDAYAPEVVDAARVAYSVERRAAASRSDSMQGMAAHDSALARAEAAMARGDGVQVSDLFPPQPVESLGDFMARSKFPTEKMPPEVTGNFLSWVRQMGGIDFGRKFDITAERGGVASNPGGIFRKGGRGVDDLAVSAEMEGYLRPGEGADSGRFVELVQNAIRGERVLTLGEQGMKASRDAGVADYEGRLMAVTERLKLLGVDVAPAGGNLAALEAYAKAREPQLLAAALDEVRGLQDFDSEFSSIRERAQQVAADMRESGRTVDQWEAEVGPLSPVMRRMVSEISTAPEVQPSATGKARNLQAELIALRKQDNVLQKLLECLA